MIKICTCDDFSNYLQLKINDLIVKLEKEDNPGVVVFLADEIAELAELLDLNENLYNETASTS